MQRLIVAVLACLVGTTAAPAIAGPVFGQASYNQSFSLANNGSGTVTTGVTYFNGGYTTVQGGAPDEGFVARYNNAGAAINGPALATPNTDFRSVFVGPAGVEYAREYDNGTLLMQTGAYNNFVPSTITLSGLDADAEVTFSNTLGQFVANSNQTLNFYNLDGSLNRTLALDNSSSFSAVSIFGNYAINQTYGTLRAYDLMTGALVDSAMLTGSISGYAPSYGQGYSNGYFFVPDNSDQGLVGYQIGQAAPEPAAWGLMILGFGVVGGSLRVRRCVTSKSAQTKRRLSRS